MKKLIMIILAAAVLVGFPYYGYGEVIYGCYQKNNGQLRIVNNASECAASEIPISWWNDAGLPGLIVVNCGSGDKISSALQQFYGNITIQVNGVCEENVEIAQDDVTLIAGPSGGTIRGVSTSSPKNTIYVRASRTVIDGLTIEGVEGGWHGINVTGSATIRNCTVRKAGRSGISFYRGGRGTVDYSVIQENDYHGIYIEAASATVINSPISSNKGVGIMINNGGSGRIGITDYTQYAGNTISNNGSNGIQIHGGGSAYIGGNTISGNGTGEENAVWGQYGIGIFDATADLVGNNTITYNTGSGVYARSSNVIIGDRGFSGLPTYGNVIKYNGTGASPNISKSGVFGFLGASFEIRYADISQNTGDGVTLRLRSTARMRSGTVNNNSGNGILLDIGGALLLQPLSSPDFDKVSATGNGSGLALQCSGGESSFGGAFLAGSQGLGEYCTGF